MMTAHAGDSRLSDLMLKIARQSPHFQILDGPDATPPSLLDYLNDLERELHDGLKSGQAPCPVDIYRAVVSLRRWLEQRKNGVCPWCVPR